MIDPLKLTVDLIRRPSVTPDDAGCQGLVAETLRPHGFEAQHVRFGDVDNLILSHGREGPALVMLGHTDVVPPGPSEDWDSPPFDPEVRDGRLYGRGAADMKSSVAAMAAAAAAFVQAHPDHRGRLLLVLTSDEEGPALDGVRRIAPLLAREGEQIRYCLVGEPSSLRQPGDTVRVGRRGSLNIDFEIRGKQGHAAYPDLADNPITRALGSLAGLARRQWDPGSDAFPATSFQITDLHAGEGVFNVIPGVLRGKCNFRYSPVFSADELIREFRSAIRSTGAEFDLQAFDSGSPFYTPPGTLRNATVVACREVFATEPVCDTGGGTSDGRFFAPLGAEVVELGPVNQSIHKVNEWVGTDVPGKLAKAYEQILETVFDHIAD